MPEPLRVGIVGANPARGWALTAHLPALAELPGFEIGAVATTREDSAQETARKFGIPRSFGDGFALIEDPDIDVVTVCVKVPHHYDYVRAAIEAGKHVFCEWPLAANTKQAVELASLAHEHGVRHVIGLQARRSPLVDRLVSLVESGHIGELLYASLTVASPGQTTDQVPAERVWATDNANGVSALSIMGGHNIDVLRYCVGEPSEVQAFVDVRRPRATVQETGESIEVTAPDTVLADGIFGSGTYCTIAVQNGLPSGRGATLEVQGTNGVLVLSSNRSLHLSDDDMVLSGGSAGGELQPISAGDLAGFAPLTVPVGPARNVAGLYLSLQSAIEHGVTPSATFDTAVDLHRVLDLLAQSSTEQRRITAGPSA